MLQNISTCLCWEIGLKHQHAKEPEFGKAWCNVTIYFVRLCFLAQLCDDVIKTISTWLFWEIWFAFACSKTPWLWLTNAIEPGYEHLLQLHDHCDVLWHSQSLTTEKIFVITDFYNKRSTSIIFLYRIYFWNWKNNIVSWHRCLVMWHGQLAHICPGKYGFNINIQKSTCKRIQIWKGLMYWHNLFYNQCKTMFLGTAMWWCDTNY